MDRAPEIHFAHAHGSSIAYEVYGDGPVTICGVPPMAQNIELAWESPVMRRMFERFAAFSRQVAFDKRGTGMSDRSLDLPALDERVDELSAVMDAAGVDRAFIHGVSEGGPMAIMFAATYPERVEGLILEGSAASLLSDEERAARADPAVREQALARQRAFVDAWGTPESLTVSLFGPSLLDDEEFCRWWPHYERHAASRDAIVELFRHNGEMDARGVLHRVDCPVLLVHRTDDQIVPVSRAHETLDLFREAGADVRLVELPGHDHFTFAGDPDAVCDAIEQFTTGSLAARRPEARRRHTVTVRVLGGFEVLVDGAAVPLASWGSRRARTLLKRLVVARGWPVTRDELIELLWPGERSERLTARLSVQLSAVRRILHGAVIADRSTVRLDLSAVEVDLEAWSLLSDDTEVVDRYAELLPEDAHEEWARGARDAARDRFVAAARRLAEAADDERAVDLLRRLLEVDPYDEAAHRALVRWLRRAGRQGEAARAQERYESAMEELTR